MAGRRGLPDLHPQLRRRERRRRRRPGRASGAGCAYLADLGVDALWITPFYPSPMADHGYDVADPRDVEPVFGDLAEFDALLDEAHALGLRVTVDLVPNHTSRPARVVPGGAGRRRRARPSGRATCSATAAGPDGDEPPNNWPSVFGGPAWTRVPDGQWYLHLFAPEQPDLDFTNPEVVADLEDDDAVLAGPRRRRLPDRRRARHGQARRPARTWCRWRTPACSPTTAPATCASTRTACTRCTAGSGRCSTTTPARMAVGEIWVSDDERLARYLRRRRAAARLQLQAADGGVDAGRAARCGHPLAGRGRGHAGAGVLGAVQPRPARGT